MQGFEPDGVHGDSRWGRERERKMTTEKKRRGGGAGRRVVRPVAVRKHSRRDGPTLLGFNPEFKHLLLILIGIQLSFGVVGTGTSYFGPTRKFLGGNKLVNSDEVSSREGPTEEHHIGTRAAGYSEIWKRELYLHFDATP